MPFDPAQADPPMALPRGTRLGEYELKRVLGIGGFGIVYLAFDHALEREVAVKEYMPQSLAGRTETLHVSLRSQSDADTFSLGLKSFVNEARLLARFDHPSLLKVHRFWEANGTAYMAMPVLAGRTLKEVRAGMAMAPDEAWLRGLLMPLLGAIERLHDEGVYHRDIAPDNIVIEAGGLPVLLDFGAARRVISDKSQNLTAILKPAYAPIEQYGEAGSVKQGPWTDFYALGATLHFLLLGRPPAPATARAVHDDQPPLAAQALAGCSTSFLQTVDWMLAPRPNDRPQSVAALRDVLEGRAPPPLPRTLAPVPQTDWERTQVLGTSAAAAAATGAQAEDAATVIVPAARPTAAGVAAPPASPASPVSSPAPPASPPPAAPLSAPPPSSVPPAMQAVPGATPPASRLVPALLVVLLLIVAAAYFLWPRSTAVAPADSAAAAPVSAPASTNGVVNAPAPAPAPASEAAPASAMVASAPAVMVAPPAALPARQNEPAPADTTGAAPRRQPATPPVKAPAPKKTPASSVKPMPAAPPPSAEIIRAPVIETAKPASAPHAAAAASAPPSAPARLIGPTERCGKRVLLALWRCIDRECAKPELAHHPECTKWKANEEQKRSPGMR